MKTTRFCTLLALMLMAGGVTMQAQTEDDFWMGIDPPTTGVYSLIEDAEENIIVGTTTGVYSSYDGGVTWNLIGLDDIGAQCLYEHTDGTLLAGTGGYYPLYKRVAGSTDLAKAQNNGLTITPDTLWFEPTPTGDIPEFVITNETSNDVIIEDIIPEDMGFVIEGIDLSYTLPAGQSVTVTVVFMPAPGKNDYLDYDILILTSIGEYHVTAMLNKTMIDYGLVIVGSPYQYVEDENGAGGCLQNRYFGSQIPVEIYSATEVGTDYLNIVPDWPLPHTLNPADWFTFMFYAKNPVKDRVITSVIVDSSDGQREFVVTISDELLSVTEVDDKTISLYPNPAKDVLNISFADDNDCQSVAIYSIDGRLLKSQNNNLDKINLANLTPGLYLIKVRMSDGKEFSEKIVVK